MPTSYTGDDTYLPENKMAEAPKGSDHQCAGVIPRTFIVCGEGDGWTRCYCSEECRLLDEARQNPR